VSITTNPRQGEDDAKLGELTRALQEMVRVAPEPARPDEDIKRTDKPSERPMFAASRRRTSLTGALRLWSVVGLLAAVCVGVIIVAWPFSDGGTLKPTSPPRVGAATADQGAQQPSFHAQTSAQGAGTTAAPIAPELTQWGQTIARELATLEQGIEQLKTSQAQLARDNAELAGRLKEAQDGMARHDAELAEGLKAVQEEMVRNNLNTAEQLKASQEQIASIGEQLKARQEQIDRLRAPKQPPRSPKLASTPVQPNATPAPKPAPKPKSAQAGQQPKNIRPSPSKPQ
jgi:hypothetical protein